MAYLPEVPIKLWAEAPLVIRSTCSAHIPLPGNARPSRFSGCQCSVVFELVELHCPIVFVCSLLSYGNAVRRQRWGSCVETRSALDTQCQSLRTLHMRTIFSKPEAFVMLQFGDHVPVEARTKGSQPEADVIPIDVGDPDGQRRSSPVSKIVRSTHPCICYFLRAAHRVYVTPRQVPPMRCAGPACCRRFCLESCFASRVQPCLRRALVRRGAFSVGAGLSLASCMSA